MMLCSKLHCQKVFHWSTFHIKLPFVVSAGPLQRGAPSLNSNFLPNDSRVGVVGGPSTVRTVSGTGPPRARTGIIYVDLGYWAMSGSIHPKGDPASWGINSSTRPSAARNLSADWRLSCHMSNTYHENEAPHASAPSGTRGTSLTRKRPPP